MPYAPGVYNHAGDYIAQGMATAAQAINQGFQRRQDERERAARDEERKREFELTLGLNKDEAAERVRQFYLIQGNHDRDFDERKRQFDLTNTPYEPAPEERQRMGELGYTWAPRGRGQAGDWYRSKADDKPLPGAPSVYPVPGGQVVDMGNGRRTFQPDAAPKADVLQSEQSNANALGSATTEMQKNQQEIEEHKREIAAGDTRYGWFNVHNRYDRVAELEAANAGLAAKVKALAPQKQPAQSAQPGTPAPAGQPMPGYNLTAPAPKPKPAPKQPAPALPTGGAGLDMSDAPPAASAPPSPMPGYALPPAPAPKPPTPAPSVAAPGSAVGIGAAATQYVAGKVYKDAAGNRAQYNEDGSWTPLP